MNTASGFHRPAIEVNPHFDAVTRAQERRINSPTMPVMADAAIMRAFDAKTADDAYALAQQLMTIAARRKHAEAHERNVT